jgi:hypothetical protein
MRARLLRDVHRRPGRIGTAPAAVRERGHLGVDAAELGVPALPDDLAVANDYRTDDRVRAHPPPSGLAELNRPPKQDAIGICDYGRGQSDSSSLTD